MVRPRKFRKVRFKPEITYFKPRGVPIRQLEEVQISVEELEALRLVNMEKMQQNEAADAMNVHQSTLQRMLIRAREKVTRALVNGLAIKIEGGNYDWIDSEVKPLRRMRRRGRR